MTILCAVFFSTHDYIFQIPTRLYEVLKFRYFLKVLIYMHIYCEMIIKTISYSKCHSIVRNESKSCL